MIAIEEEVTTNQAVETITLPDRAPVADAPSLQDAEEHVIVTLRCFVRQISSGCYVAECIDLDISAEAKTQEKAVRGLRNAMIGYLHVVLDGQGTNAVASLMRPSPLRHRIRYFVELLKCKAIRLFRQANENRTKKFYDFSPSPKLIRSHCTT
jgi:hypothetical protein